MNENPKELADPSFTWFGNTMTEPAAPPTESKDHRVDGCCLYRRLPRATRETLT